MYSLLAAAIVQSELLMTDNNLTIARLFEYLLTSGVVLRDNLQAPVKEKKKKKCQDYFPPLYLAEP